MATTGKDYAADAMPVGLCQEGTALTDCTVPSIVSKQQGGDNCRPSDVIRSRGACLQAAKELDLTSTHVGQTTATDRPAGCFWDRNAGVYYNSNTNVSSTNPWDGTGGICRRTATNAWGQLGYSFLTGDSDSGWCDEVNVASRSIPPQWRSTRSRPAHLHVRLMGVHRTCR